MRRSVSIRPRYKIEIITYALGFALLLLSGCENIPKSEKKAFPNILLIMADDMGYGDPGCFNPESKISTPEIDKLADSGMRFTNAHAPGATCTPSRYGLLTGRYPFRNTRNYKEGLIEPGTLTIAKLLQNAGYQTGCVGKWHQGMVDEKKSSTGRKTRRESCRTRF
jgi:arylsulfatase A